MIDANMTARIETLEERIAFQDQTIEQLSEALTDQWKLVEALKRDVERLGGELKAVEDNIAMGEQREPPPPHY